MMSSAYFQRGAALLVLLLIVVLGGLASLIVRINENSPSEAARATAMVDDLVTAKTALIGYASSYREQAVAPRVWGYLPCPDNNNNGAQDIAGGCSNANQSVIGRFPYRTLGMQDLRDHTGECLWYVVSASHKHQNNFLRMTWDLRGNLRIVDSAGNVLADPDDADGGAVAAIIAPGPPLAGQNRGVGAGRCSGGTTNDFNNWLENDPAYVSPAAGTLQLRQGDVGSPNFNDRIVWITARELYEQIAGRGDLLGGVLNNLSACFNAQVGTLPLPALANEIHNGAADPKTRALDVNQIVVPLMPLCGGWADPFDGVLWVHWQNHFSYVVCKDGATQCLTVGANACTGALLFGGRNVGGAPRTLAELNDLNGHFEDPNRASLNGVGTDFAGSVAYSPAAPAQDIVMCLNPLPPPITLADPVVIVDTANPDVEPLVSISEGTLTLGKRGVDSDDAPTASLFGCAWVGESQPFGEGLRAYFRYRILDTGEGFVFSIVDSDRNPSTNMCGAGGRHLGYAGLPESGIAPILYPKIGLEIDTRDLSQSGYSGDANSDSTGKNDPNSSHMALVFWGQHDPESDVRHGGAPDVYAYAYDDNVHEEPRAGQPVSPSLYSDPVNPVPYENDLINDEDQYRHVRIEVSRVYGSGVGAYSVKVWLDVNTEAAVGFADTTIDYGGDPVISETVSISDLFSGTEVFKNFRIGFTNSSGRSDQEIEVTNLEVRKK